MSISLVSVNGVLGGSDLPGDAAPFGPSIWGATKTGGFPTGTDFTFISAYKIIVNSTASSQNLYSLDGGSQNNFKVQLSASLNTRITFTVYDKPIGGTSIEQELTLPVDTYYIFAATYKQDTSTTGTFSLYINGNTYHGTQYGSDITMVAGQWKNLTLGIADFSTTHAVILDTYIYDNVIDISRINDTCGYIAYKYGLTWTNVS